MTKIIRIKSGSEVELRTLYSNYGITVKECQVSYDMAAGKDKMVYAISDSKGNIYGEYADKVEAVSIATRLALEVRAGMEAL